MRNPILPSPAIVPRITETKNDQILAGPNGGSYFNNQGRRRSARVKAYQDGHIHLNYHENPYMPSPLAGIRYNTGEPVQDPGVTVFKLAKGLLNKFVEGVAHINLSPDVVHKMTQEEVNYHVLGVIMSQ